MHFLRKLHKYLHPKSSIKAIPERSLKVYNFWVLDRYPVLGAEITSWFAVIRKK